MTTKFNTIIMIARSFLLNGFRPFESKTKLRIYHPKAATDDLMDLKVGGAAKLSSAAIAFIRPR